MHEIEVSCDVAVSWKVAGILCERVVVKVRLWLAVRVMCEGGGGCK